MPNKSKGDIMAFVWAHILYAADDYFHRYLI